MIKLLDVYEQNGAPRQVAIAFLFELITERMTEPAVNISASMPSWDEHVEFVKRVPYRFWYLISAEPQERREGLAGEIAFEPVQVGYVSATRRNEIGIVLLKVHRGRGYGAQAVRMLMEKHKPMPAVPSERRGRWIANVNPANEHSKHLFGEKLGGRLIQLTYEL